ncbi:MAG: rod-binding protein [Alphaproteobacteria bacterium]
MMDSAADMMMQNAANLAFGQIPYVPREGTPEAIREAAQEFEAVFMAQMMEPMFEDISTDGLFGGGQGESIFRSLLVQEFGEQIAKRGGLGISDAVAAELLRAQEAQSGQTQTATTEEQS